MRKKRSKKCTRPSSNEAVAGHPCLYTPGPAHRMSHIQAVASLPIPCLPTALSHRHHSTDSILLCAQEAGPKWCRSCSFRTTVERGPGLAEVCRSDDLGRLGPSCPPPANPTLPSAVKPTLVPEARAPPPFRFGHGIGSQVGPRSAPGKGQGAPSRSQHTRRVLAALGRTDGSTTTKK